MAIEVCSEISISISSPRLSFSRDLNNQTHNSQRLDTSLLDSSSSDFDFCIGNNRFFQHKISSADELFSNGKILPLQSPLPINKTKTDQNNKNKKIIRLKEFLSMSEEEDDRNNTNTNTNTNTTKSTTSFWQFKRSSSLNCDSSTRSKSLIKSLHFLARSNSTGSAPKQNLQRQPSVSRKAASSTYYYSTHKSPLRKCRSYNGNGGGVRISPVLNIGTPCLSNSTVIGLFGFCNGKFRKKKKT